MAADPGRQLYNMPMYYTPGAPQIASVQTQRTSTGALNVTIGWSPSSDPNGGVGYDVMVSTTSRGWNYDGQSLPTSLMPLKSSNVPWNSSMYAELFTLPKSNAELDQTTATTDTVHLTAPGKYFITVMAFDAHGTSVGRTLYYESEEICITA